MSGTRPADASPEQVTKGLRSPGVSRRVCPGNMCAMANPGFLACASDLFPPNPPQAPEAVVHCDPGRLWSKGREATNAPPAFPMLPLWGSPSIQKANGTLSMLSSPTAQPPGHAPGVTEHSPSAPVCPPASLHQAELRCLGVRRSEPRLREGKQPA